MGVYIPNEDMPKDCYTCFCYETEFNMCSLTGKRLDNIRIRQDDCPLIEIDEPNGILAHDIRKVIAFIDPHMIIATTYDEQIERAKAVKDWLLSIVGERRADEHTD